MTILGRLLVPFIVLLAMVLLRRYMPASPEPSKGDPSFEELDARFSATQWVVNFVMVAVGIVFALATHAVLVALNRYLAASDGAAQLYIWPQSAIWWFFPGFGALILSWEITLGFWSLFGGRENARLFASWTSLKAGFDSTKALRWAAVLIALPIGVLTALTLPMHTAILQNDIRDCGYGFSPCTTYLYSDARRMTIVDGFRTRDGKLTHRAGIVIDFQDGRRWTSADEGDFQKIVDPELEEFLENRTGLNYGYAESESDIPPLPPAASQAVR